MYVILFAAFILIFTNLSEAAPILRIGSDQTVTISFDNRFEQASPPYSDTKTFNIYNDGNTSMTLSGATASSPGSGISLTIVASPGSVPPGGSGTIQVSINVPSSVPPTTYTGDIFVNTVSGGSGTMKLSIKVSTLKPAKLGSIGSISTMIKFDRPKGTVSSFQESADFSLRNVGDAILYINSIQTYDPSNGIDLTLSDYPSSISPGDSKTVRIPITAPSTAREGTFNGKIAISTSKQGKYGKFGTETADADISVTIEYGVNMELSKSSIAFGDTELLKEKEDFVDISETLGYKSINDIKITKTGTGKWISINPGSLSSIGPFSSERIYFKLLYDGEAEPYKDNEWVYTIASAKTTSKTVKVNSKMIFDPEIPKIICGQKYNTNTESKEIAGKMCSSLTYGINNAGKTFKISELILLYSVAKSTIDLLDSYQSAENSLNKGEHDSAYEPLMKGVVSSKIISTYSEKISDNNVKNDIRFVNEKSSSLTNILLDKETKYYESKVDSDLLESMIANERLSELWGILGNEEKRQISSTSAKAKFEQRNNFVDSAKNYILGAQSQRKDVQNNYLSKWGAAYILTNPLYYSKVSHNYDSIELKYNDAIKNYRLSGEKEMEKITNDGKNNVVSEYNKIKSIFFILIAFYLVLFIAVLARTTKAMMAYIRDTSETRMGDNFL